MAVVRAQQEPSDQFLVGPPRFTPGHLGKRQGGLTPLAEWTSFHPQPGQFSARPWLRGTHEAERHPLPLLIKHLGRAHCQAAGGRPALV